MATRSSAPKTVSKYFDFPSKEEIEQNFGDNLDSYAANTPIQIAVRNSLLKFKQAYLAADTSGLRELSAEKFRQIAKAGGKILTVRRKDVAFDFENHAKKYQKIEFNIKSITHEVSKGVINAILTASYHGKYFTTRFLEVFAFGTDGKTTGKLMRQTRSSLVASHPKHHDVKIFVVDQVSKNDLKEAFSSPSVDEKLDDILKDAHESFPQREDLSILYLFREAPRAGSIIRIHDGLKVYEYKVSDNNPYFIIENQKIIHIDYQYKITFVIYMDGVLVGRRVTSM